uniref:Uncharacterized protein n=1 Tax=Trichogramma kaykai TaxID=54128 RepID=A0ABD2WT19_9HYME
MVLNEVESMINLYDDTLNNIFAIISYARVNLLHPELINPTQLHKVIRQIEDHNGEIEFPLPIDKARIEKLTNIADINLGYKDRKIVVKVRIPLLEKNPTYLYRMHSVPIAQRLNDAKISASVKPRSKYIAVNEHAQYYSFLNVDDLQDCKQDHHRKICPRKHLMIEASTVADCEYMLLHKPSLANLSECNLMITSENRDTWIHLDTINGWLYSLKDEHSLLISCEDQKGYVTLQGVGILQLKPKCQAKYKHITITSQQGIGESIQFFYLPNLRLNVSFIDPELPKKIDYVMPTLPHEQQSEDTEMAFKEIQRRYEQLTQIDQTDVLHKYTTYSAITGAWILILVCGLGLYIIYHLHKQNKYEILQRRREDGTEGEQHQIEEERE